MKIAMVMPFFSENVWEPDHVIESYPILRMLPAELARMGHSVTVLVHSPVAAIRFHDVVRFEFIQAPRLGIAAGRAVHRWKPRYGAAYYVPTTRLVRRLKSLNPDVAHYFGLTMDLHLALALWRSSAPVVAHFHGGVPGTSRKMRTIQGYNLKRLARVLFTAPEQAEMWIQSGLGLRDEQVDIVLETSSPFRGIDRKQARELTGMEGNPVYLSAGRLHPVKDIATMLRGYALIRERQPESRLYLYYSSSELLDDVRSFLADHADVAGSVELRGRVPLLEMEAVYSSADFLLQASLREWSGLAVLEAMSCGCIPVVTNIPSFSSITNAGVYGRLFEPGDATGLADAALGLDAGERGRLSAEVQKRFREALSFEALARDVERVYLRVLGQSR